MTCDEARHHMLAVVLSCNPDLAARVFAHLFTCPHCGEWIAAIKAGRRDDPDVLAVARRQTPAE